MSDTTLTPEELDAVMDAVAASSEETASDGAAPQIKVYDFANPNKFSKEQLRALEMIYSSFARDFTTQLGTLIRIASEVELDAIIETSYGDFFASMPHAASIALLNIEPLSGRAMLSFDPALSFSLVDRLLGGPGRSLTKLRDLTEIEKGLLKRIIDLVSKGIAEAWNTVVPMKPELDLIIGSTLFSQVALPDDRVMLANFTIKFGSVSGTMHFGIPTTSLDPILSKLTAQQWFSSGRRAANETLTEAIRTSIVKTHLDVAVELGRADLLVRELLDLQVGDLICLDRKAGSDLDILVDAKVKFRGQPGQVGRRLGIKITEVVSGEE